MNEPKQHTITITEIGTKKRITGKIWEQGAGEKTVNNEKSYGYTPEIEKIVHYQETIYEQTVKDLDLGAIVSVVNGLGGGK